MESAYAEQWKEACLAELRAFIKQKRAELPAGRKAISCYWVFEIKLNEHGKIDKFGARIVCRDYQLPEIDFDQAHAPTARVANARMALAIVASYGLDVHQMDVCTAFLGSPLEEIYATPPARFFQLQSPMVWYGTLREYLEKIGIVCHLDGGLFVFKGPGDEVVQLLTVIYVDDLLLIGKAVYCGCEAAAAAPI